jgi:hypothetical protein
VNVEDRAMQFWSVLVLAARNQRLLSYTDMEALTGIPRQAMGTFLGPVASYCIHENLPQLTSIVVGVETGRPGDFYPGSDDVHADQARAFVFDWFAYSKEHRPNPEIFAAYKTKSAGQL